MVDSRVNTVFVALMFMIINQDLLRFPCNRTWVFFKNAMHRNARRLSYMGSILTPMACLVAYEV